MPFSPGQSGNPGGRPSPRADLARRVRDAVGDCVHDVVAALLDVARDPRASHRDRVAACREILARGWARPARVPDAETARAADELRALISTRPAPDPARSRPDPADPLAELRRLAGA